MQSAEITMDEHFTRIFDALFQQENQGSFEAIIQSYNLNEDTLVKHFLQCAQPSHKALNNDIEQSAENLIQRIRNTKNNLNTVDLLLRQYSLDSEEGLILMCLAEALLRIPDKATAQALIKDQIGDAKWEEHIGKSESLLINMSNWGLLKQGESLSNSDKPAGLVNRLIGKLGQPLLRSAIYQAMKMMSDQFIAGDKVTDALSSTKNVRTSQRLSYELIGEPALSDKIAKSNLSAYMDAIKALSEAQKKEKSTQHFNHGFSVKLSRLHPKFDIRHSSILISELLPQLIELLELARNHNIPITIEAEQTDKLEVILLIFKALYQSPANQGWGGLGMTVQAYTKQALATLHWLAFIAKDQGDEIPIQLIKGAYWNSEIKQAQQNRLSAYPVFTQKDYTELSYFVCAQYLLTTACAKWLKPQFATHNIHTMISLIELAKSEFSNNANKPLHLQHCYGVGELLCQTLTETENIALSMYVPIGTQKQLSPYLMRRLLECGSKTSPLYRLTNTHSEVKLLSKSPIDTLIKHENSKKISSLTLPCEVFLPDRLLPEGTSLANQLQRNQFIDAMSQFQSIRWNYGNGDDKSQGLIVTSPHNKRDTIGCIAWRDREDAVVAINRAERAWGDWQHSPVNDRIELLNTIANHFESNRYELMALCTRELGFTWLNSQQEVHRAIDYCRYYANQAEKILASIQTLPSLKGETNRHYYTGRGIYFCISPWHSPLATFVGQIVAALVTANCVIAKPAEQSSLTAMRATELMYEAGVPQDVLQCLPGSGTTIGDVILNDERVKGVVFTGAAENAQRINQILSSRPGPITPLMADTGGQNAMIADSTARPEEVVRDIIHSAFNRAGQRTSSLRVVCLQDEIYDEVISLLKGAMDRFIVGSPCSLTTDCGPVIDKESYDRLNQYIQHWRQQGWVLAEAPELKGTHNGYFISPIAIGLEKISELDKEQFGPILHVYRYQHQDRLKIVDRLNRANYGLTLSIHSRNPKTASEIEAHMRVGNCYVNRHQIDAVIGSQPFGGQGLSGTGPKSGGPDYLKYFCSERVTCTNTSAIGVDFDLWR